MDLVGSLYIAASWIVVFMAPYLEWPEWIQRLSIFDAFGHPFIDWPSNTSFLVIIGMIVISFPLAVVISNRRPKVV
jgi:hypothetical protein